MEKWFKIKRMQPKRYAQCDAESCSRLDSTSDICYVIRIPRHRIYVENCPLFKCKAIMNSESCRKPHYYLHRNTLESNLYIFLLSRAIQSKLLQNLFVCNLSHHSWGKPFDLDASSKSSPNVWTLSWPKQRKIPKLRIASSFPLLSSMWERSFGLKMLQTVDNCSLNRGVFLVPRQNRLYGFGMCRFEIELQQKHNR